MNWKFWTWAKQLRAQQKQIRELKVRLERRRWLLAQAHQIIHQGIPSHAPSARRVRDEITTELNREA